MTHAVDTSRDALRVLAHIGEAVCRGDLDSRREALETLASHLRASRAYLLAEGEPQGTALAVGRWTAGERDALMEATPWLLERGVTPVVVDGGHFLVAPRRGAGGHLVALAAPVDGEHTSETDDLLSGAAALFASTTASSLLTEAARAAEIHARATAIVGASLDGVITIDHTGTIVELNAAACEIFGLTRDHIGREMAGIIVPPELREAHRAGLARHLGTGEGPALNRRLELPALKADGTPIAIELVITPLDLGRRLYSGFVRDVTEQQRDRQRLSATTSRLRALIANLGAGVLVEDEERRIVLTNHGFTDLFGIPADPEALVGADCSDAAGQSAPLFEDPEGFVAGVESLLRARETRLGEELRMRSGAVLERDYVPIFVDEAYRGHLWLYRDVTSRKEDERRRERLLADERQLRARLERQNHELAELDRFRTELVATVSHELRTPLTSIVSLSGLLADPAGGELDDEQREFVAVIERNAERLLRVIDDLLLLARLDMGKIELSFSEVDVEVLVADAALAFAPQAEEAGVRLEVSTAEGPALIGDRVRLAQVVDNLVSNALKFTPAGGRITVDARPAGEAWTVRVADTGIGIPEADRKRLFQRFYRARGSGGIPGTGLGLAVVAAIVDHHDGSVRIESTEGEGTTVTLRLPVGQVGGSR